MAAAFEECQLPSCTSDRRGNLLFCEAVERGKQVMELNKFSQWSSAKVPLLCAKP